MVDIRVEVFQEMDEMKLFLISQTDNNGYDTYDSAVVAAEDESIARYMHPGDGEPIEKWGGDFDFWCSSPHLVTVRYLGEADSSVERGVICASFNAG